MNHWIQMSEVHDTYKDFMAALVSKPPTTAEEHTDAARTLLRHSAIQIGHFNNPDTALALAQMATTFAILSASPLGTASNATPPIRTTPRDGDAPMPSQPKFCELGDRVSRRPYINASNTPDVSAPPGAKGTVTDITRGSSPENDSIRVRWDNDDYEHGTYPRNALDILSHYDGAALPDAAAQELSDTYTRLAQNGGFAAAATRTTPRDGDTV